MFCPGCSTENDANESYCRKCGLSLSAIRMALDGTVDKALTKLKKSERSLRIGVVVSILLFFVTLYAAVRSGPFQIVIDPVVIRVANWLAGMILSMIVGLPIVVIGLLRLRTARRLLEAPKQMNHRLVDNPKETHALPPAATPLSVTEETTLKLSQQTRRR